MVVSIEAKHLLAASMLLLGLLIGWLVWGVDPSGRYQRAERGYVLDTKTGHYIDPATGKTLVEIKTENRERAARLAIWNIVKGSRSEEISNEGVREELVRRGHEVPQDFDDHFNRARRWTVVNRWQIGDEH